MIWDPLHMAFQIDNGDYWIRVPFRRDDWIRGFFLSIADLPTICFNHDAPYRPPGGGILGNFWGRQLSRTLEKTCAIEMPCAYSNVKIKKKYE